MSLILALIERFSVVLRHANQWNLETNKENNVNYVYIKIYIIAS